MHMNTDSKGRYIGTGFKRVWFIKGAVGSHKKSLEPEFTRIEVLKFDKGKDIP